ISLLQGKNVGCVLVTGEKGELVGIFTERDVLYRVAGLIRNLGQITVESLMTHRPTALSLSAAIQHALHLMSIHGFRHVPLLDEGGRPVGFVSFRDIVRFIEKNFTSAN
ncbi:MAG: CBS domain-containing protein, partial [Candidatus Latescibacteria bacterium]|nr:CBS domain-containing protein [Candidatus Latescibacterota bacterium]